MATFRRGLSLNGAKVGGGVFLRNTSSFGDVDLIRAQIGIDVTVGSGATFKGKFLLHGAEVGGSILLRQSSLQEVSLQGASVAGNVDLSGSQFAQAVTLSAAAIEGTLNLPSPTHGGDAKWTKDSLLDLRRTTVGGINDNEQAWPQRLHLAGFVYKQPFGELSSEAGFANRDVVWYRKWLERSAGYSPQPYEQLAVALRSGGRPEAADGILIESRDREYQHARPTGWLSRWSSWPRRVFGFAHKVTVGYGYHPEWAIWWVLLLVGVGWLFARRLPPNPKASSGIILSLQKLIPLVNFGKDYSEADMTSTDVPRWVRRYFYLHAILGYVLAAFLLAALTRLTTT